MERCEMIKGLAAFGVLALLPGIKVMGFFDHRGIVTNYNRLSIGDAFGKGNETFEEIDSYLSE